MIRRNYVLTQAAEADLRSIIRYARKQWGHTGRAAERCYRTEDGLNRDFKPVPGVDSKPSEVTI